MKKSTDELLKILKAKTDINDYFEENKEAFTSLSLCQSLEKMLTDRGVTKACAIQNSFIEKHYAYQIFSGKKTPSRDKLIMICIGIGVNLQQTQRLLSKIKAAPLYPKDPRDSVIIFGILHALSVMDINVLLYEKNFQILE